MHIYWILKKQSAYYCMDPNTNRVYASRHVRFVKTEFPYPLLIKKKSSSTSHPDSWCAITLPILENPIHKPTYDQLDSPGPFTSNPNTPSPSPIYEQSTHFQLTTTPFQTAYTPSPSPQTHSPISSPQPTSQSQTSTHHDQNDPITLTNPIPGIITRSKNNIVKPNPKYANITTTSSQPVTPSTVKQTLKDPL